MGLDVASRSAGRGELASAAGLILPGGESTTLWKFFEAEPWEAALADFAGSGRPILGTCAGAIVLAREVTHPSQKGLGLLDISVERNAYGRQVDSFVGSVEAPSLGGTTPAVFIRAPRIRRVGPGVEVARDPRGGAGPRPAGQRRGRDVPPGADGGLARARVRLRAGAAAGARA